MCPQEEVAQTWMGCLFWLTIITIFISLLSAYLVDAIEVLRPYPLLFV
jgi:hypothetical protein